MGSSRWCVIVTFQPLDVTRTSKTSFNDVSRTFGVSIFAFHGSWEARTKIDLIVSSDEKPSKIIEDWRMNANDFQVVKVIGRGAFGEVQLVSYLSCSFYFTDDLYFPQGRILLLALYQFLDFLTKK